MTNVAHDTNKNNGKPNGKPNGKGAWKLTDKERDERRATADELSQQNERDRSRLLQAKARAAEVKELIKATDLGAEAEELKDEIKHLETSIDARSETVERCLREARTGKTDRQQDTLPGVPPAADKSPPPPKSAPRPSAAERTVPLLPEWSSSAAGEAEVHPGGELAPEPPAPPPLALPPHVEAIEAEIVDEAAEARAREAWRALVLDALGEEGPLPLQPLHAEVLGGSYERGVAEPDTAQIKALLAVMVDAGAIVLEGERYALPTPPKGKKSSKKAPAPKAAPKAKPQPKKASKGEKKGTKAEAPADAPPAPPMGEERDEPADSLPLLLPWLHKRLLWAGEGGVSFLDLCDEIEPTEFFFDELNVVADLLVVAGLARTEKRQVRQPRGPMRPATVYVGVPDEHGREPFEALLDELAGTLADGDQHLDALVRDLSIPHWALNALFELLYQAGRAHPLPNGLWSLGRKPLEAVFDELPEAAE